jgi:hypothetical protein
MGPNTKLLIVDRVMLERLEASPLAQSHALLDLTMMMFTGGAASEPPNNSRHP